jgi:glyoxylase-like metal-dependent hydrolase (beta-lactamase superfamily II)
MDILLKNINRRTFLQIATLTTAAIALNSTSPMTKSVAEQKPPTQSNSPFYRFSLGDYQCISISDGTLTPPNAAAFAGNAPPQELTTALKDGFQTSENFTVNCNILFVNTGKNKVLIDAGGGFLVPPTAGKLVSNLKLLGISPREIDTIIISHAHGDHIGGLTDKNGKFIYPNAKYYINRGEFDFWTNPKASLPKIGGGEKMAADMIATAKKVLEAISKRVVKIDVEKEIIPGFFAINAHGHTPGHIAIRIKNKDISLIHVADAVHTHTVNLRHPEWRPIFDADAEQAALTRQRILSQIATERTLMYAYHFPFPGLGHIRERGEGGYSWEPMPWQLSITD